MGVSITGPISISDLNGNPPRKKKKKKRKKENNP